MEKLDSLLMQSEEMLSLKLMADRHLEDQLDLANLFGLWDKQWAKIYPIICEYRRLQEKNEKQGGKRRQDDIRFAGDAASESFDAAGLGRKSHIQGQGPFDDGFPENSRRSHADQLHCFRGLGHMRADFFIGREQGDAGLPDAHRGSECNRILENENLLLKSRTNDHAAVRDREGFGRSSLP